MIFTRVLFSALAAASFSTAMAFTGRGTISILQYLLLLGRRLTIVCYYGVLASWDSLGTTPCVPACPASDFRVALPSDLFPGGESCCHFVQATCMLLFVLETVT
jgi:hypothetical protein